MKCLLIVLSGQAVHYLEMLSLPRPRDPVGACGVPASSGTEAVICKPSSLAVCVTARNICFS